VSYDGAGEPLGRSQVIAYLRCLAASCEISLISFEKDSVSRAQTAALLDDAGIRWRALSYHKRPPVLSTLWDMLAGARAVREERRQSRPDIIHVRSVVPGLIALISRWPRHRGSKLLYDARGFWADERVLGGLWRDGGILHRIAKRGELLCFREADAVVTLSDASVPQIRAWLGTRQVPLAVIPTCAEVERFSGSVARPDGPRAVWCGSVGSFYRFDLAVRFAEALGCPLTVLTRQVEDARAQLGERKVDLREVAPADVPAELRPGDIGICFYADGFANLARAPTRFAEYAAAGMIVAATPGIGDLDEILTKDQVGVIVSDHSDEGLARAATRIRSLAADPDARTRARRVAAERYSLHDGADAYLDLYRRLQRGADQGAPSTATLPAGATSG
jgi:glycosyltransferase involved in cell wall biosynthesis